MLTFNHLKHILSGFTVSDGHAIDDDKELLETPDIQEGYHYDDDDRNDVPNTRFEQSIYVMRMASRDKGGRAEELKCFADVKRIRALLLKKQYEGDPEMRGWIRTARRDFVSGAANYVGWKLRLPFLENESWEL